MNEKDSSGGKGDVRLIRMPLGPNDLLLSLTSATQAVRVEEIGAPRPWAWSLSEDVEVWRNHPDADQVIWIIGGILRAPLAPGVDRVSFSPRSALPSLRM